MSFITVQYKINLKYMFKDILYPTLRSLQNQTLDGHVMYLTGSLVFPHLHLYCMYTNAFM